ncbi:ribonucleoside-diphosphate reductase large subunit [Polyporus arcularius HHB13444]|uniref:Ribonucleoside-diphosphate reductase n=1 Tax=Polyporus arcularius HHB13444 TaxID=1314778 RepID=A0A5C3P2M1_9APHY|nr:ribonucleoside-diphosphate reductase large subunit [Polyporus arcularius HHB13444]
MYMRVALSIHKDNIPLVVRTYEALSRQQFTFATPVLANAGTLRAHFTSCFLYTPDLSNPEGMMKSAHDLDLMWLADGGIGLSLAEVPCRRPRPHFQPGVLPLMRLYDAHAEYTSLWRQTRSAAATVYLPIWHGDVRTFATSRTNRAARHEQVKNLYAAVWVPDVFMERSDADEEWNLFDPKDVPALQWTYGETFTAQYLDYERSVAPVATVQAREIWKMICRAQQESGVPFILFQDAINAKNNESHLGIVKTSNLCTEIVQFSSREQTAVCTLASIAVPRFAHPTEEFDFEGLHETTKLAVQGLNQLIDMDNYPTPEARMSAQKTRALGVGVQGLADAFMISRIPFGSSLARDLNTAIFETVYHGAYEASTELAQLDGPYPLFEGSPASGGTLQHDMWPEEVESGRYDFGRLRTSIKTYGLRNSMLTAQMPTASTSRLLGNFDGTEPYTSNVLVRRVISGDYTEVCPWLVRDLESHGIWTEDVRVSILKSHGSVQDIASVPEDLKELYRTAWEIEPTRIVDLAADRGPFIDQTQSMSLNMVRPSPDDLMCLQLHAWRRGLKTGVYYLRTKAPASMLSYGVAGMKVPKKHSEGRGKASTSQGSRSAVEPHCEGGCAA